MRSALALCLNVLILLGSPPPPAGADDHAPGMTLRHLWTVGDAMLAGAISADGRSLCFVDWTAGNVAIRGLPEASTRLLTTNESWDDIVGWPEEAALSRDGRRVACTWYDRVNKRFELRVVDRNAPQASPITRREPENKFWVRPLDWAPDGRRLAAVFSTLERKRLVIVSIGREAITSVRVLKTWRGRALPTTARFSWDGAFLAFDFPSTATDDRRDLFVIALATGIEAPLVIHPAGDRFVDWTPDGRHILFTSDRSGDRSLWVQGVAAGRRRGKPRMLKRGFRGRAHGLDRHGALYFSAPAGRRDVMIATIDENGTGFSTPLAAASARFVHHTSAAEWSPDGRFLAYRCGGDRARKAGSIAIRDLATGEERNVRLSAPVQRGSNLRWLRWARDSKQLRFVAKDASGKPGFFEADVETGAVRRLTPEAKRAAAFAPDGKRFYYWRDWRQIVRCDIATGEETVLHSQAGEGGGLDVSPDGKLLLFRRSPDSIAVLPTAGGYVRELYRFPDRESNEQNTGGRWTPDGKRVLFVRRGRELWSVNVLTKAARRIGPDIAGLTGVSMHPDGRRIAFTTGRSGTALWVMEGFLPR